MFILLLASFLPSVFAQGAGVVAGRVYNPATGQFVRNAQIRIVETGQSTVSGDGGSYRISPVAPGTFTVEVTFTGYRTDTSTVSVGAGQTAQVDFELRSTLAAGTSDGDTIKLDQFVVSGEREGNAKAIMEQRNSMNITNSVASDVFGDVAEGNVGEFLKHMPGVSLNLVDGVIRNVSLRGLGPEYTNVTLDGSSLASADANTGAAGNARAFAFEQVSLSSIESIEVSKTISADVDANAPAGTINLKTKRAFDRPGRRITIQANATASDREFSFARTVGPDDGRARKIRGGGIFEYSDVFLDGRLGVVLNISESNQYTETDRTAVTYNTSATAMDSRAIVPTAIAFTKLPFTTRRSTITLSTDYKLTNDLVVSLGVIHSDFHTWAYIRALTFNALNRGNVVGDDPVLSFTTTTGTITPSVTAIGKYGDGTTITPRFEYKRGGLTIEGRFSASDSVSIYKPNKRGSFRSLTGLSVSGIPYSATRSGLQSADWNIRQIGGVDIADGGNFTNPTIDSQDGRYNKIEMLSGDISASLDSIIGGIPVTWKTGVKKFQDTRTFELTREAYRYNYIGPGSEAVGAWASFVSPYNYDLGSMGVSTQSISMSPVYFPAMQDMYTLFRERPEFFTPVMTATNYYNAYIANKKYYKEEIDAAFFMGTANLTSKITMRAGLRWEKTSGDSLEFDPLPPSEVIAAGYSVAGGRATTVEGVKFQYESRPRVHRRGSYDHLFPSASLKFRPLSNLDFQLGFSSTIRRPTFRDVAGVWTINEETLRVIAPNPNLPPEESNNFSLRTAYYFEPVGVFAVNLFQNNVKGLHRTNLLTAEEFGYTGDLDLSGYLFSTAVSSQEEVTVRGMELEYSQSLSFLPSPWSGLNVRASYTRNYADVVMTGMEPHAFSSGLSYRFRGLSLSANLVWHDDKPTNVSNTAYVKRRANLDLGGSVRLTERLTLSVSARNVLDDPRRTMNRFTSGGTAVQTYDVYGTNFTVALKAVF